MSTGGIQAGSPCILILAGVAIGLLVSTSVMKLTGVSVEERSPRMRVVLPSLQGRAGAPSSFTRAGRPHAPGHTGPTNEHGARDRLILVNTMVCVWASCTIGIPC